MCSPSDKSGKRDKGVDSTSSSLNRGTVHSIAVEVRRVGWAVIVTTHTGANQFSTGAGGVVTLRTFLVSGSVIGWDNLFDGLIPAWVVMKEGACWGFYLFKHFVELF